MPTPAENSIPARIRARREYLKLPQAALADVINRSRATIAGMEAGYTPITAAHLEAFAKVLKVPLSYFYEETSEPQDDERDLLQIFRDASPATRRLILATARTIAQETEATSESR
jgi:transcriptional regulator with XRE-family HTH domain